MVEGYTRVFLTALTTTVANTRAYPTTPPRERRGAVPLPGTGRIFVARVLVATPPHIESSTNPETQHPVSDSFRSAKFNASLTTNP